MKRTVPLALLLLVLGALAGSPAGSQEALPHLYGVVLTSGDSTAYLDDPTTGRVRAYKVGDMVGASQLVRIEANRVILQRDGEPVEVVLAGVKGPPTAAPPFSTGPASSGTGDVTGAGQAAPCPPNCPPATTVAPGFAIPGMPCPPNCPPATTTDPGASLPGQPCPPNCPPPTSVMPGSPTMPGQPCPPACPSAEAPVAGQPGPAGGGAACPPNCPPPPPLPTGSPQPCPPACPPAQAPSGGTRP